MSDELPPKCKNCTLEEVAVLRIMHENPSATQKEIATAIGKSERTVKTLPKGALVEIEVVAEAK